MANFIGTGLDQVPLNQYLGSLAYQNASSIGGPVGIGGALTLSSGTANGVTYLNGSKVLTSGSALTYNGTGLGVGSANPGRLLVLDGGASGPTLQMTNTAAGSSAGNGLEITFDGTNTFLNNRPNGYMWFGVNATEQMRLTSTGLGIGTSSPSYKLDVSRSTTGASARFANSTSYGQVFIESAGTNQNAYLSFTPSGTGNAVIQVASGDHLQITQSGNVGIGTSSPAAKLDLGSSVDASKLLVYGSGNVKYGFGIQTDTLRYFVPTGSAVHSFGAISSADGTTYTERMRLDSSGNLGLGVTPSAWATLKAFEMGSSVFFANNGGTTLYQGANAYYNAGWLYKTTAAASLYTQSAGVHQWSVAASGTAGNTVTFTQAMTLDASGNLGLGTTSPTSVSSYRVLDIDGTSGGYISLKQSGTTYGVIYANSGQTVIQSNTAIPMLFNVNGSERARIDSSGNLGVGTTSPSTFGTFAVKTSLGSISIASGGSVGARLKFYDSSNTQTAEIINNGGSNELLQISATAATGSILFNTNSLERARFNSSGTFILKNDYQEQTYTANSSTAITLNITTNGTDQVITLTGTATITMPTAVAGKSFLLKLKTGSGGYTVTWSTVKWPGGTAPTLTSAASKMDIFSFFSDGTNWYGTTVGQNYTP